MTLLANLESRQLKTLITHAKVTESYDQDACIKVSVRVGDVTV